MSDAKDQHEPSMEEILASIRRIISEDGEEEADAAAAPPSERAADDVLVLTDEVDSEGVAVPRAAAEEPAPVAPSAPVEEPVAAAPEPEPEPISEPEPMPAAEPNAVTDFGQRLISETTAAASLSSLSQLVNRSDRDPNVQSMRLGQMDQTLEELVRDLLRPMLKSWLDENLPQLVERIVREEIGRLALDAQRR